MTPSRRVQFYGPGQVWALVAAATEAGVTAEYREIASTKGHDAFLVEWPQLAAAIVQALGPGAQRRAARPSRKPAAARQGRASGLRGPRLPAASQARTT